MGLAIGIILIWTGAACLWVASRGTAATTPWGVYQEITDAIRGTS